MIIRRINLFTIFNLMNLLYITNGMDEGPILLKEVDKTEICPCLPRTLCPRVFGESTDDVKYLGNIMICASPLDVRCCGVSTSVVIGKPKKAMPIITKNESEGIFNDIFQRFDDSEGHTEMFDLNDTTANNNLNKTNRKLEEDIQLVFPNVMSGLPQTTPSDLSETRHMTIYDSKNGNDVHLIFPLSNTNETDQFNNTKEAIEKLKLLTTSLPYTTEITLINETESEVDPTSLFIPTIVNDTEMESPGITPTTENNTPTAKQSSTTRTTQQTTITTTTTTEASITSTPAETTIATTSHSINKRRRILMRKRKPTVIDSSATTTTTTESLLSDMDLLSRLHANFAEEIPPPPPPTPEKYQYRGQNRFNNDFRVKKEIHTEKKNHNDETLIDGNMKTDISSSLPAKMPVHIVPSPMFQYYNPNYTLLTTVDDHHKYMIIHLHAVLSELNKVDDGRQHNQINTNLLTSSSTDRIGNIQNNLINKLIITAKDTINENRHKRNKATESNNEEMPPTTTAPEETPIDSIDISNISDTNKAPSLNNKNINRGRVRFNNRFDFANKSPRFVRRRLSSQMNVTTPTTESNTNSPITTTTTTTTTTESPQINQLFKFNRPPFNYNLQQKRIMNRPALIRKSQLPLNVKAMAVETIQEQSTTGPVNNPTAAPIKFVRRFRKPFNSNNGITTTTTSTTTTDEPIIKTTVFSSRRKYRPYGGRYITTTISSASTTNNRNTTPIPFVTKSFGKIKTSTIPKILSIESNISTEMPSTTISSQYTESMNNLIILNTTESTETSTAAISQQELSKSNQIIPIITPSTVISTVNEMINKNSTQLLFKASPLWSVHKSEISDRQDTDNYKTINDSIDANNKALNHRYERMIYQTPYEYFTGFAPMRQNSINTSINNRT